MARSLSGSLLFLGVCCAIANAHVGSPDIYLDGKAGPYQLFITVRPPTVIPGVATLEIQAESPGVDEIRAVPMPMSGPGARFAPVSDRLKRTTSDEQYFTGSLWMMAPGSWQVRVSVTGKQGAGSIAVPVPSVALGTKKMQPAVGTVLLILMAFLVFGAIAMVGAAVREAKLAPGEVATANRVRAGRVASVIAFVVVMGVLWFGSRWWSSDEESYRQNIYKPLRMSVRLEPPAALVLTLKDPGWLNFTKGSLAVLPVVRTIDDLIPDHDHLMHLYVIRQPGLDAVYHLHPELVHGGVFRLQLPDMRAGTYKLYADIVHANGFPETLVAELTIPAIAGHRLTGDDAAATAPACELATKTASEFSLPDGYRMEWVNAAPMRARRPEAFRFRLVDGQGKAPADMALYMGMPGHAAFVKTDGTVFAHIHPTGSISMAAFMQAQFQTSAPGEMAAMDHSSTKAALPNEVSFPYGVPSAGSYRIFVQMKHGTTIETGVFDATAD